MEYNPHPVAKVNCKARERLNAHVLELLSHLAVRTVEAQ
jgi:hypothetical protein